MAHPLIVIQLVDMTHHQISTSTNSDKLVGVTHHQIGTSTNSDKLVDVTHQKIDTSTNLSQPIASAVVLLPIYIYS